MIWLGKKLFKLMFYSILLLVIVITPGAIIVGKIDNRVFEAALTRPQLIVRKMANADLRLVYCVCSRTLRQDEIPETVAQALVAIEDKRFFSALHVGIDLKSQLRALFFLGRRGGGSSLHQQLAKRVFVGSHGSSWRLIFRKYLEPLFAFRIASHYSKNEVLALYLSRVDFGTVQGVQILGLRDAARVYFGKPPIDLSLEQAALLVGMLKATHAYNPIRRPKAALKRAEIVLNAMQDQQKSSFRKFNLNNALPKKHKATPIRDRFLEDHLIAEFKQLSTDFPPGDYRINSTIDPIAQYNAKRILTRETQRYYNRNVTRNALVSLDGNGRILALVGGRNYLNSTFNIATKGLRQAASTAKLITYLAALENGLTPSTLVFDDQRKITGGFVPRNYDYTYKGKISLEQCFVESRNVCTMWIAEHIGFDKISQMAQKLDFSSPGARGKDIVLGASETTLLRSTAAFSSLNNNGQTPRPKAINSILGAFALPVHLETIEHLPPAYSDKTQETMKNLLRKVVVKGTGKNARFQGANAHGKTGTSQENRDAWFVGFTSDKVATGVWVGPPELQTMRDVSGGELPAQIFSFYNVTMVERFNAHSNNLPLPR